MDAIHNGHDADRPRHPEPPQQQVRPFAQAKQRNHIHQHRQRNGGEPSPIDGRVQKEPDWNHRNRPGGMADPAVGVCPELLIRIVKMPGFPEDRPPHQRGDEQSRRHRKSRRFTGPTAQNCDGIYSRAHDSPGRKIVSQHQRARCAGDHPQFPGRRPFALDRDQRIAQQQLRETPSSCRAGPSG